MSQQIRMVREDDLHRAQVDARLAVLEASTKRVEGKVDEVLEIISAGKTIINAGKIGGAIVRWCVYVGAGVAAIFGVSHIK